MEFLERLFDTSDFPARWHCGHWTPAHGWLHVLSDIGIFSAYFAIPAVLAHFLVQRRDLPFRWLFALFCTFIFACGTTHLMEAAIFWWPAYRLAGALKLFTALVSWTTVLVLLPSVPKILSTRSPEALEREIALRRKAEADLHAANAELERRVEARTAELQDLAERLADADRRKNEFLAMLAHELRNPLAPLRTGIELLQHHPDAAERGWAEGMMERQMRQLVTIVDDLLDVSRITRGKLELRRAAVPLAEVVQAAVEAARPHLDAFGHRFEVLLPAEPLAVHGDPHRLAQVVSNLLNNAAKYTPDGGRITLRLERRGEEAAIVVSDTGRGLEPETIPHVFDMYMQAPGAGEKGVPGLGIGLTLVKALVEMHGGRVQVASEGAGRGSEFTVTLPLLEGESTLPGVRRAATDAASAPPCRILVADDNEDAAAALALLLRLQGHDVATARDGAEALEAGEAHRPHVVFLDLGMPRMDGFAAARAMRERPWGRDALIVALTGLGQEADRQRTREAGFDHHLVKPARPEELKRLLAERRAR